MKYFKKPFVIATFLGLITVCSLTFALLQAWHPFRAKEEVSTPRQEMSKKEEVAKTPEAKTSDLPKQTTPPVPTSSSPACKLFTKSLADQALKAQATLNTKDSATISETSDLQISFCTYTASERAVTLVAYIAKSDIGKSINSVEFGSGRPAGVQNITTIGQSAFWSDTLATMYVLKNNNRYTIALTKGTQAETLEAAKIIIPNV
jgi:hypothetical protein